MNFVQLRAFHFVATEGGFSRAAQALGLTQPAVSDQVLSLERAYDVRLFHRRGRQVTLSEHGERLLRITRPLFEQLARAREALDETRALSRGRLEIIADSAHHVTGLLGRFRARFPGVRLVLRSGNSAQVEAELTAWRADIGVIGRAVEESRFRVVSLGASPIVAIAARDNPALSRRPARLAELAAHPLVLRETGSRTRQKLESLARAQGIRLTPAIEVEGREAMRDIVAAGGGIGFVSAAEFGADSRLVPIPLAGQPAEMEELVICMRQRAELRTIRAFMEMAEAQARAKGEGANTAGANTAGADAAGANTAGTDRAGTDRAAGAPHKT